MTTENQQPAPTHVSLSDAAAGLGVHRMTVLAWVARGRLKMERVADPTGREIEAITRESYEAELAARNAA